MSLFKFGELEIEVDFTDAAFMDRIDQANEILREEAKCLPKEGKASDLIRAQNACYDRFFDNIFGEGASKEMFVQSESFVKRLDAADAISRFRQSEDDKLNKRLDGYAVNKPNREQRRNQKFRGNRR